MTTPDPIADLAAGRIDDADIEILQSLHDVLDQADPMPAGMTDRIRFAMSVAALEAELAEIISTSDLVGATRTTDYDRVDTVTFAAGSVSVMVTIEHTDDGSATIAGWVTGEAAQVELRERSRSRTASTDHDGRFVFTRVERGMVHFLVRFPDDPESPPVITPVIEI